QPPGRSPYGRAVRAVHARRRADRAVPRRPDRDLVRVAADPRRLTPSHGGVLMASVPVIGLDLGSTSVRAVETRRGKDGPVLTNYGQAPLPPGAVQGGAVQDERAVTLALKQLWAGAKFRRRDVVLGVTNPQVV